MRGLVPRIISGMFVLRSLRLIVLCLLCCPLGLLVGCLCFSLGLSVLCVFCCFCYGIISGIFELLYLCLIVLCLFAFSLGILVRSMFVCVFSLGVTV